MLDANSKEWSLKEVVVMVNMIGVLAGQLKTDSVPVGVASMTGGCGQASHVACCVCVCS